MLHVSVLLYRNMWRRDNNSFTHMRTLAHACAHTQGLEEERGWKRWVRGPSTASCVQKDTYGSPQLMRTLWTFMSLVRSGCNALFLSLNKE